MSGEYRMFPPPPSVWKQSHVFISRVCWSLQPGMPGGTSTAQLYLEGRDRAGCNQEVLNLFKTSWCNTCMGPNLRSDEEMSALQL